MNYIAHLYFAEPTPESRVGSLMGDFWRGALAEDLHPAVAEGIRLHRAIDAFTDRHEVCIALRRRMAGPHRRYAGVVLDLAFDHFLVRDWERWHSEPLERWLDAVYRDLAAYRGPLPARMRGMLERMVQRRWLASYREPASITRALTRMAQGRRDPDGITASATLFFDHYASLEEGFSRFFCQLVREVAGWQGRTSEPLAGL